MREQATARGVPIPPPRSTFPENLSKIYAASVRLWQEFFAVFAWKTFDSTKVRAGFFLNPCRQRKKLFSDIRSVTEGTRGS
jgi:hypothetical protein